MAPICDWMIKIVKVNKLYLNSLLVSIEQSVYNFFLNPLLPNISMHILHTVLYTFPEALTRRICIKIKSFISWGSFP